LLPWVYSCLITVRNTTHAVRRSLWSYPRLLVGTLDPIPEETRSVYRPVEIPQGQR
jgi:hypothetical protein